MQIEENHDKFQDVQHNSKDLGSPEYGSGCYRFTNLFGIVCTCAGMWTDMYVCVPASVPMFCVCVCVCV